MLHARPEGLAGRAGTPALHRLEACAWSFYFLILAARLLTVIPNEAGWNWGGAGEGSPRSDLSGLASTLLLDQVTAQV